MKTEKVVIRKLNGLDTAKGRICELEVGTEKITQEAIQRDNSA